MPGVKPLPALAVALLLLGAGGVRLASAADPSVPPATPKAQCGPGSKPETGTQGRVSTADVLSGRAAQGYTCNAEVKGHFGRTGGFRAHPPIRRAPPPWAVSHAPPPFPRAVRERPPPTHSALA